MSGKKLAQTRKLMAKYWVYYVMFIPCAVALIMFSYIPMGGIILAFKEFYPRLGMYYSPFAVPLHKHFLALFSDDYFWTVLKNTVVISLLRIAVGFPSTIVVALLFNELKSKKFAKFVQTVMFIPYFISWIVLAGMVKLIFSNDGLVNSTLAALSLGKISFLTSSGPFLALIILVDVWKNIGYGMIIYLASMSSIDSCLYEAIDIDGGGRIAKMVYVTLPGIKTTIAIQLILSLSGILNGGFDLIYNLYSVPVYNVADILDTYLYRVGMNDGKVELSTALGFFKSVVGFAIIYLTNKLAKKLGGEGIY